MNAKERDEFKERCRNMTTEDLLSATTVHRKDYQDEALHIMDRELASRNVPVELKEAIEEDIVRREQATEQHYRGIRGWLIVFILVVAGGSFINMLAGIAALSEAKDFLAVLLTLPTVLIAIYGFIAFVMLLRKKPSAPTHAARWMIANFVYIVIAAIIVYALTRSTADGIMVLPSALGLLLWLTYLKKSKRVAATYRCKTQNSAKEGYGPWIDNAPREVKDALQVKKINDPKELKSKEAVATRGDRLRVGMTYDEVVRLLGEPSGVNPGTEMLETGPGGIIVASEETRAQLSRTKYCMWKRPEGRYLLTMKDGKLSSIYEKP